MTRRKLLTPNYRLNLNALGVYEVHWTENNNTQKRSTRQKDKAKAELAAKRIIASLDAPEIPDEPTVEAICKAYEHSRLQQVASPDSLKYALTPIIARLGPLEPRALTDPVISDYAAWRRKQGRNGHVIGDGTIIREIGSLKAALAWGKRNNWITDKPEIRQPVSQPPPRERWITKPEAKALVRAAAPHISLYIRIATATAARRAAILELPWARVTWPRSDEPTEWRLAYDGEIEYEAMTEPMLIDFGKGAGNKRRGKVPIGDNADLYHAMKKAKSIATSDYVIEYRGKRVSDIKTGLARACERADIEPIGAHALKHTAVTWMVQGGITFERIAKLTGTSAETIERVYGHHSPAFLAEVGDTVSF